MIHVRLFGVLADVYAGKPLLSTVTRNREVGYRLLEAKQLP